MKSYLSDWFSNSLCCSVSIVIYVMIKSECTFARDVNLHHFMVVVWPFIVIQWCSKQFHFISKPSEYKLWLANYLTVAQLSTKFKIGAAKFDFWLPSWVPYSFAFSNHHWWDRWTYWCCAWPWWNWGCSLYCYFSTSSLLVFDYHKHLNTFKRTKKRGYQKAKGWERWWLSLIYSYSTNINT